MEEWSRRHSCTRKELESFIGHLAHAATVIRPGKIFLMPLFCLLSGVHKPHHFVCINAAIRADLQWWSHFLQVLNETSFFSPFDTLVACLLRCIRVLWVWCICGLMRLVQGPMASYIAGRTWFQFSWQQLCEAGMSCLFSLRQHGCCFYVGQSGHKGRADEPSALHPVFLCSLL